MAELDSNKNTIITVTRRRKLVQASAGVITLPIIVGMAFGDGGVDDTGAVIAPTEDQTELRHELYRKPISGFSLPDDTTCQYQCVLDISELAGEFISELGLYDEDGDIIGIKTFLAKGKDDDVEETYTMDDVF